MAHSRETEHYQLPLYDGTDIINPLTDFNEANEAIDEAIYNANQHADSAVSTAQGAVQQVGTYDERITAAQEASDAAAIKSDNTMDMIAEKFNPLKEDGYKVGDMVIYNQRLYTFINPHTGAWDASDVKEQPIGEALEDTIAQAKVEIARALTEALAQIASQMQSVPKTQAMIAQPFDENKVDGYEKGECVTYADKLYMFNADHVGAWTGMDVDEVSVVELISMTECELVPVEEETIESEGE